MNAFDAPLQELDRLFDEQMDHFHSGVISDLADLFIKACRASLPEHRFFNERQTARLQDIAYEATATERLSNSHTWVVTACRLFEQEGKLSAVKFVRNDLKVRLIEAKRIVERLERIYKLKRF